MDSMEYKISSTIAYLRLLHKDTQIKIENPLKINNSFLVGKAIGIIFVNTRFRKTVYNFREAAARANQGAAADFITIK